MHQQSGSSVLVLIALVVIPGVPARAQAPAAARPTAHEPLAHTTAEHVQTGSSKFHIKTVSARNDMISSGVLVRINASAAAQLASDSFGPLSLRRSLATLQHRAFRGEL
jgi:hypothetical protein